MASATNESIYQSKFDFNIEGKQLTKKSNHENFVNMNNDSNKYEAQHKIRKKKERRKQCQWIVNGWLNDAWQNNTKIYKVNDIGNDEEATLF